MRASERVGENFSLSLLRSLVVSHLHPRLTPWATFFRRFAAEKRRLRSTAALKHEFSRTLFSPDEVGLELQPGEHLEKITVLIGP